MTIEISQRRQGPKGIIQVGRVWGGLLRDLVADKAGVGERKRGGQRHGTARSEACWCVACSFHLGWEAVRIGGEKKSLSSLSMLLLPQGDNDGMTVVDLKCLLNPLDRINICYSLQHLLLPPCSHFLNLPSGCFGRNISPTKLSGFVLQSAAVPELRGAKI